MNILDHRILIPKSPQIVWEHLGDLSKNPTWQVDYSSMSFLTSRHSGSGVRWRYTSNNGREYVAETTAWYDALGYEYTFVDGVSFRENKGRIRLQEIAEGTVVQWTFTYDMGGLLGGMRNALTFKRQFETVMVDSLKTLWRVVNQSRDENEREAKAILRAGLDYEARAQYKPRHPSIKAETPEPTQSNISPVILEPPISDEDTRPRAPVVVDVPQISSVVEAEPISASDAQFAPPEPVMVEPRTPTVAIEEVSDKALPSESSGVSELPPVVISDAPFFDDSPAALNADVPSIILPEQPIIVAISSEDAAPTIINDDNSDVIEAPVTRTTAPVEVTEEISAVVEPVIDVDVSKKDTVEVSVFDLFGVPKPSATQEMRPVKVSDPEPEAKLATVQSAAIINPTLTRSGLRLTLRRKRVRARRPG
jgi:hypothetical protein